MEKKQKWSGTSHSQTVHVCESQLFAISATYTEHRTKLQAPTKYLKPRRSYEYFRQIYSSLHVHTFPKYGLIKAKYTLIYKTNHINPNNYKIRWCMFLSFFLFFNHAKTTVLITNETFHKNCLYTWK